ncbi:uncharacterized protein BXZ73DRAFT_13813, partial [Epithele typhae]|uniref:uncharacterized protein n=1 Tax=Epithele typhae TaxID=378194 RepID=UPI0020073734
WHQAAKLLYKRDNKKIKAWQDELDGFLNFSSLFSAVVTFFLTFTYADLLSDDSGQMVQLLFQISQQLAAHEAGTPFPLPPPNSTPFVPQASAVVLNSLLMVSLVCSLIASGKSLWLKEWLREYKLDLPRRPRELLRVRQHRHHGLSTWRMQTLISLVSFLLQLSVALFAAALVLIVWPIPSPPFRILITAIALLWISTTLVATACALVSTHCPFKSPLA